MREARAGVLHERSKMAGKEYTFGEFRLRPQQRELLRDGRSIRLEKIPFDLLVLLVERAGDLIPRDEIATRIWQGSFQDIDASLSIPQSESFEWL
jgi:DNA-binding winged helix-turn-helix (wHTH) protein